MKPEVLERGMLTGYLIWVSWQDIRQRSVSLKSLFLGGGVTFLGLLLAGWEPDCRTAWIPGAVLFLLSKLTDGVGEADGLVLIYTGLLCRGQNIFLLSGISLMYIFLYSMIHFMRRKNRNGQIPYLPFLLAAYVTTWNM